MRTLATLIFLATIQNNYSAYCEEQYSCNAQFDFKVFYGPCAETKKEAIELVLEECTQEGRRTSCSIESADWIECAYENDFSDPY